MSDSPKDTPDDKGPDAKLGINRYIYATGNSVMAGIFWGSAALLAAVGLIAFGKKAPGPTGEAVRGFTENIEKMHASFKEAHTAVKSWSKEKSWLKKAAAFVEEKTHISTAYVPPNELELGASVALGAVVGHVAQLPYSWTGLKHADEANKRYTELLHERNELIVANDALKKENKGYKAAVPEQADTPFAERVQKPETEAVPANVR